MSDNGLGMQVKEVKITDEGIAKIVYEMNRHLNFLMYGEDYDNIKPFKELNQGQVDVVVGAVKGEMERPAASSRHHHERWKEARQKDGWRYGEKLDRKNKINPNLVPYEQLPVNERLKDDLFRFFCDKLQKLK